MASPPLLWDHYPWPSHHGNRKTSGRAHRSRALNQEGDQLRVPSNQALPAPLHLASISLLIAIYSLCNRRANVPLTQPPTCTWFHFPPTVLPFHTLLPTLSSASGSQLHPLSPPRRVPTISHSPLFIFSGGIAALWGWGPEPHRRQACLAFFLQRTRSKTKSFWRCTEPSQGSRCHSLFKVMLSLQLSERHSTSRPLINVHKNSCKFKSWRSRKKGNRTVNYHPALPFSRTWNGQAQRKNVIAGRKKGSSWRCWPGLPQASSVQADFLLEKNTPGSIHVGEKPMCLSLAFWGDIIHALPQNIVLGAFQAKCWSDPAW